MPSTVVWTSFLACVGDTAVALSFSSHSFVQQLLLSFSSCSFCSAGRFLLLSSVVNDVIIFIRAWLETSRRAAGGALSFTAFHRWGYLAAKCMICRHLCTEWSRESNHRFYVVHQFTLPE